MRVPRPEHSGHIPCGELNENSCGDGSGNEIPQSWQARCCDITFSAALGGHDHDAAAVAQRRLHGVVQALGHALLGHQPVHHHVDGVLLLLVEADLVRVLQGTTTPSTRARVKPALLRLLEHVAVLALALLHEGAQEQELRSPGRSLISCTICWDDCWETGRPQLWQVSRPTRAQSTRR
jgi:hypothetical protein